MRGEAALLCAGLVLLSMLLCALVLLLCFAGAGALVVTAVSGLHNATGEPDGRGVSGASGASAIFTAAVPVW